MKQLKVGVIDLTRIEKASAVTTPGKMTPKPHAYKFKTAQKPSRLTSANANKKVKVKAPVSRDQIAKSSTVQSFNSITSSVKEKSGLPPRTKLVQAASKAIKGS